MEEKVIEILKNVFDLETVDSSLSQATCEAWDSMGQLNLIAEIEDVFGISIEPDEMGKLKDFGSIIELLQKKGIR